MSKRTITKEEADKSFKLIVDALDLAMSGRFPMGLDHIESHASLKAALFDISGALNVLFAEPQESDDAGPASE